LWQRLSIRKSGKQIAMERSSPWQAIKPLIMQHLLSLAKRTTCRQKIASRSFTVLRIYKATSID
jgi:hypothetical protein